MRTYSVTKIQVGSFLGTSDSQNVSRLRTPSSGVERVDDPRLRPRTSEAVRAVGHNVVWTISSLVAHDGEVANISLSN